MNKNFLFLKQRSFTRSVILFICIICIIVAFLSIWNEFLSPQAQDAQDLQRAQTAYEKWEAEYNQALAQDIYGGKTPEETLSLFIEALEKNDTSLASNYFMLGSELHKQPWVEWLEKIKSEGNLEKFAHDLKKAERGNSITEDDVAFVIKNEDGTIGFGFRLKKIYNQTAVIWKIQEM